MSSILFNIAYSVLMALVITGVASLACEVCNLPRIWAIVAGLATFALMAVGIAISQISSIRSQEKGE